MVSGARMAGVLTSQRPSGRQSTTQRWRNIGISRFYENVNLHFGTFRYQLAFWNFPIVQNHQKSEEMLEICAWRCALVEASRMISPSRPLLGVKLKRQDFWTCIPKLSDFSKLHLETFRSASPRAVLCAKTLDTSGMWQNLTSIMFLTKILWNLIHFACWKGSKLYL